MTIKNNAYAALLGVVVALGAAASSALASPDITTERSIRFVLWNGEEANLDGARAYVAQRKDLQGQENPPGSGKYPEPK